jgi:hypothetical protein
MLLLLAGTQASANHILSARMNWTKTANAREVRVDVFIRTRYEEVAGIRGLSNPIKLAGSPGATQYCSFLSANGGLAGDNEWELDFGDGTIIRQICFDISDTGTTTDCSPIRWVRMVASFTHTYPVGSCPNGGPNGNGTYTATLTGKWRAENTILNDRGSDFTTSPITPVGFVLHSLVQPCGTNSSPAFLTAQQPTIVFDRACPGACATYQLKATDPDGNPITYSMATPTQATGIACGDAIYGSRTCDPPGLSVSATGLVTWCNDGLDSNKEWSAQFYVTDASGANGVLDVLLSICGSGCIPPEQTGGCTLTQGFWKNHSSAWPVPNIIIGGHSYSKAQAISLIQASGAGDKRYDMFQQLVAAKLNVIRGANTDCVVPGTGGKTLAQIIALADAWFGTRLLNTNVAPAFNGGSTTSVGGSSTAWQGGSPSASLMHTILDNFNNGLLDCADHCDDNETPSGGGNGGNGKGKNKIH